MKETNIMRLIMAKLSTLGFRVFRNNTGKAYVGDQHIPINTPGTYHLNRGDMIIRNYRIFHAGLMKGSSDLIGWKTQTITPDMVGKKIAIFTAVEVKTPNGKPTNEQLIFIKNVNDAGGIAIIMRSPEDQI